jgi:SNF2 family DNA or RNA helicase
MIVVHGSWVPSEKKGSFFLWGETRSTKAGRRARREDLPRHPYHCSRKQVEHEIFRPLGEDGRRSDVSGAERVLVLPTVSGVPLPSPEMVSDAVPSRDEVPTLSPWRVRGLSLAPLTALGWLVGQPSEVGSLPDAIRLGEDVRYWVVASRLALEILARQRFLPDLETRPRGTRASTKWEPLLEEENERLELLIASMPPVCRAFVANPGASSDPETLLRGFFADIVDEFVRQAASRLRLRPRVVDSEGARFAAALLDPHGQLSESQNVLVYLKEELSDWKQFLEEEIEAPFKVSFRLEPPKVDKETAAEVAEAAESAGTSEWILRYFLQAVDDPSLLVPVARVWEHSGATWRYLNRRMDRPQERILEALGRASSFLPAIEQSLKTPRPEFCRLSLNEAYQFLRETSFLLRESGFGVLIPSWWGERESNFALKLRVSASGEPDRVTSSLGLDSIVNFDWQVALGDESLNRDDFLRLVELKQPLVRVRGRWVELERQKVEEVLTVMRAQPTQAEMPLREVMQLGLGRRRESGLAVTSLEADGWIQALLGRLTGSEPMTSLDTPESFRGRLRPYQVTGLSWLNFLSDWGLGACLADDMGLGKTIQVLALLLHLQEADRLNRPFLLICPTSVVSNWRKEAERFAPSLRVLIHHGLGRHGKSFAREAVRHDLVVSSYSLLHRDSDRLRAVEWGGLVLDEAQNIKNPSAKQTQALRRLSAPTRIALTGTPVENRLSELWSIMEFLNTGYLGSRLAFKRNFSVPIERYRDSDATEELHRLVRPFVLRRLKTDPRVIKDLPEKNEMKVYCSLTSEQATLYEAVVRESLKQIDRSAGIERRGEVLAALTRLKQICNHPAHYLGDGSRLDERSGKLARLREMLEEVLAEGDRALVFTQFAKMGGLLQRHLRESLSTEVLFLHGGVPAAQREKMIERFQDDPNGPSIFVLSLKAGGFGLNLTQARHVFHFDRWWNPAVEDQATDRAFRIGQTRSVSVYKYICAGTVEERIDELIEKKKELAGLVVRAAEEWLTELSTTDLRELFALRHDTVLD